MSTSALFSAKTSEFSRFMVCPQDRRGVEPVRTFSGEGGEGSVYLDFMQTSVIDGPLHITLQDSMHYIVIYFCKKSFCAGSFRKLLH